MAVTVNPAALYAFKEHQLKVAEEVSVAKKYSDANLQDMSWTSAGVAGQFLWSTAISGIKNIHQGVDANLTLLHSLTTVSANEIGEAGDMYAHADQYHAQQIDNKYEGTPEWNGHGLQRFSVEDPASKLQPPKAEELIPGGVDKALGVGSWLSLSHWVLEAIDQVCGVNPGKWVLEKFTGDWEVFGKVADALRKIGEFYNSYGENVSEDMVVMLESWMGKAAGSAKDYFSKFGSSVQHQQESLEKVARDVDKFAQAVASLVSALNSLLEFLLDKLIIMGISLAAGAITAETGIGAVVGGLFALSQAFEAEAKWKDILKTVDSGWALVNGFIGASMSACADLTGLTSQMRPGAYQHPEA